MNKKDMFSTVRYYTKGKAPKGYEWGVIASHNSINNLKDPEEFIITVSLMKSED